jgi:EpsI family protein
MRHRIYAFAVALILLGSAALGYWARPTDRLADHEARLDLETVFPARIGEWELDQHQPVAIVSPDVQQMLNQLYNQTLSRTYVNPEGYRIMLSVAYGGDQSKATRAHRPDVCYPAQGFEVLSNADAGIALPGGSLPVRHMVARLGSRVEPVSFWFAIGELVAVSGQDQTSAQWHYGLRGLIADGMLVRVSSIDPDIAQAYKIQDRFVREMFAAFDPAWTPRVFGRQISTR